MKRLVYSGLVVAGLIGLICPQVAAQALRVHGHVVQASSEHTATLLPRAVQVWEGLESRLFEEAASDTDDLDDAWVLEPVLNVALVSTDVLLSRVSQGSVKHRHYGARLGRAPPCVASV